MSSHNQSLPVIRITRRGAHRRHRPAQRLPRHLALISLVTTIPPEVRIVTIKMIAVVSYDQQPVSAPKRVLIPARVISERAIVDQCDDGPVVV